MCGRFTLTVPTYEALAASLGIDPVPGAAETHRPRYNIAPTDPTWVVRLGSHRARELSLLEWGLVPRWSKSLTHAGRPINARAESLEQKPAFRDAFARRRCVVVSDGFFEWDKSTRERRPLWFRPPSGGLLLLGGLWDRWFDVERGKNVSTFAVVTTDASADVRAVHDRMPLVLAGDAVETWLAVPPLDAPADVTDDVRALLAPAAPGSLVAVPVSKRVGSVKNDDPSVLVADTELAAEPRGATLPLFADAAASAARARGRR